MQEHEDKPEDCIPAEPGNEEARNFLAHAPTKGLWMPLGKEVKVMQCEYYYTNSAILAGFLKREIDVQHTVVQRCGLTQNVSGTATKVRSGCTHLLS